MNCFWCGQPVTEKDRCPNCGRDQYVYRKILAASGACYNRGLRKARVHDLSGAINDLTQALRWNKENTDARNLLGLVYYQLGEYVEALEEWSISLSFKRENNDASRYLNSVSDRSVRVTAINQVAQRYNQALKAAKKGDTEKALMMAHQVIQRHPTFVRGYLLAALLYLKKTDAERAEKMLLAVLGIDSGNVAALTYLKEARALAAEKKKRLLRKKKETRVLPDVLKNGEDVVLTPKYREATGSFRAVVLMLLGVLMGALTAFYLLFPVRERELKAEANQERLAYYTELQTKDDEIERLTKELEAASTVPETSEAQESQESDTDGLLYLYALAAEKRYEELMENLLTIRGQEAESAAESEALDRLIDLCNEEGEEQLRSEAITLMGEGNTEAAEEKLNRVLLWQADEPDSLLLLGRLRKQTGEIELAREIYNRIIELYPDTPYAVEAQAQMP